jgi:uncharacterized protein (TIGR02646 family)
MKIIRKSITPPLLKKFLSDNSAADWSHFRKSKARYHQVTAFLYSDQRGICAYCEIDLLKNLSPTTVSDFRVEHFHPKSPHSPPPNWSLDWNNLLGVCHGGSQSDVEDSTRFTSPDVCCDVPKGNNDWTNEILNPLSDIPAFPPIFSYTEDGHIEIGEHCPKILKTKANGSIVSLRLNSARLVRWRKELIEGLRDAIYSLVEDGSSEEDALELLSKALFPALQTKEWPRFFSCIRWYLEPASEDVLTQSGYLG